MPSWGLIAGLAIAGAIALGKRIARRSHDLTRLLEERGAVPSGNEHVLVRRGVQIRVRTIDARRHEPFATEALGGVLVPSGLRFLRRRNWAGRAVPSVLTDLDQAPEIDRSDEGVIRSDTLTALPPLDELGEPWRRLMHSEAVLLGCNGPRVLARVGQIEETPELLDGLLDAVVAVARWDDGFGATLASLPGAEPLIDHELAPGVHFPDGLVLGVRDGTTLLAQLDAARGSATATVGPGGLLTDGDLPAACVAALARTGEGTLAAGHNGARFTWATIERDPARHRAAIEALRALAAQGPYR
jgi:hypothetical protein